MTCPSGRTAPACPLRRCAYVVGAGAGRAGIHGDRNHPRKAAGIPETVCSDTCGFNGGYGKRTVGCSDSGTGCFCRQLSAPAATITVGFKPRLMLPQPSMEPSAYRWRSSRVGRSRTPTPPAGPPKTWRKMTPQHKMRIASISKVIIGMEAMRLMERGIIDLDNPIGVYWGVSMKNPHYPNDPVTIRNLDDPYIVHLRGGGRCFPSYGAVRAKLSGGSAYRNVRPQYRRLGLQQLWVQRAGHDAGVGRQRQNERSAPPRSADAHGY